MKIPLFYCYCYGVYSDWLKISTNDKQTQNPSHLVHVIFSRALRKFQVIARNSDQLLVLLAPVVIGCYSVWNWFFESHLKIAQYWYLILFTGCSWTAGDKGSRRWKGSSGKLNKNCLRIFHVYYLLLRPFAKETKRFRAVQQLLQTTRWSWTKSKILYVIHYIY